MMVDGVPYRTIWVADDGWSVEIIDQTRLPFEFAKMRLRALDDVLVAIRTMQVRGAPLIGVTAAYGICLQTRVDPTDAALDAASEALLATRPTAVNLRWALSEMRAALSSVSPGDRQAAAYARAAALADEDAALCRSIGENGLPLLEKALGCARERGRDVLQVVDDAPRFE